MGIFRLWRKRQLVSSSWQPTNPEHPEGAVRRTLEGSHYVLPKDLGEINRLDFQHHLLRMVLHGDYVAPLPKSVSTILDVGAGTGRWCRDMAKHFPNAGIIGLDLEPPDHKHDDPPTIQFVKGNILAGLPFNPGSFDYVHQRLLVAALPALSWPEAVRELARVTRRGGWLELLEVGDIFVNAGPLTEQLLRWGRAFAALRGINAGVICQLDRFLRGAGLYNVVQQPITIPIGAWGGHIGKALERDVLEGFRALKDGFVRDLGLTDAEIERVLAGLPAEWRRCQSSYVAYSAYGQKG